MLNLFIGVPSIRKKSILHQNNIDRLRAAGAGYMEIASPWIDTSREEIFRQFLKTDKDFLWMQDDDNGYDGDILDLLTSAIKFGKDVLAYPYLSKDPKNDFYMVCDTELMKYKPGQLSGVHSVKYAAAGAMLISRKVVESMPEFCWTGMVIVNKEGKEAKLSDSYSFCEGALQNDFGIWCDFSHPFEHKEFEQFKMEQVKLLINELNFQSESMHRAMAERDKVTAKLLELLV